MGIERRREERKSVSLDVWLKSTSGNYQARISDISLSGCFIDTLATHAAGEIVAFNFLLPGNHMVELLGKVTYQCQHIGFGVQFLNLPEERKRLLQPLMDRSSLPAYISLSIGNNTLSLQSLTA